MKNIALPLVGLLVGVAVGYSLRSMSEGGEEKTGLSAAIGDQNKATRSPQGTSAISEKAAAGTAALTATNETSLSDRMKELLLDFDVKSARKAAAKLSASDLQAALALVAAMPKSADRDALRAQLYRAWAALNPNAAWRAALADPLDKDKGYLVGTVAAEVAKTNPIAAIDLAQSLGMGERRSAVMNAVFREWCMVDVAAAVAYNNEHPDQPVDAFAFYQGLGKLAETQPMQAANLITTLKDQRSRDFAFSSLMSSWMSRDSAAALRWAETLSNPNLKHDAIAAAIGAWAKTDPIAALTYARNSPDGETRTAALQNAWKDWFRKDATAATAYLASSGDDMLMENVSVYFDSLSAGFTTKELAALLVQFPEGKAKQRILGSVTDSQIRKGQFNQALEMLNTMPDSTDRDRSVHQLGQEWAKSDLAAAAAWLKIQPDSTDRDLAVAGYASTLARSDPLAALELINPIPDPKLRTGAMKNIAMRWFRVDAAKAEAWMTSVPEFSETDKKFIRSMSSMRGDYLPSSVTVGTRR